MNVLNNSTHPTGDASDLAEEPKTCVSCWKRAQITGSSPDLSVGTFRISPEWLSVCPRVDTFARLERTARHAVKIFSEEGESGGIKKKKKKECAFKIKSAICVCALCVTVCVCVIYYSHRCVFFRRGTKDYSASTIQLQLSASHNTVFTHPTRCSASVFPSMPHPVAFSPTFPPPLLLPAVFASPCLLHLLHLLLAFNPCLFPRRSFTSLDSKKLLILYSLYLTC